MKTLMVLLVLSGSICRADKESEKGRLDDCFRSMSDTFQQISEKQQSGDNDDVPALQGKVQQKRVQCLTIKTNYEKSYGKYIMPKF